MGWRLLGALATCGLGITPCSPAEGKPRVHYVADFDEQTGSPCRTGLVLSTDGNFYGTTTVGGAFGFGALFRLQPTGVLTTLHAFDLEDHFIDVVSQLVQGSDGALYGVSADGGTNACGVIMRMTLDGQATIVHAFNCDQDGRSPNVLVQGSPGELYGVTTSGGEHNLGTVFRLGSDGSFATLASFDGTAGSYPYGSMVAPGDGNLYGVTQSGGAFGVGVLFRFPMTGGSIDIRHSFSNAEGMANGGLVYNPATSQMFGTTAKTVFRQRLDGAYLSQVVAFQKLSPMSLSADGRSLYALAYAVDDSSKLLRFDLNLKLKGKAGLKGTAWLNVPPTPDAAGLIWGAVEPPPAGNHPLGALYKVEGL